MKKALFLFFNLLCFTSFSQVTDKDFSIKADTILGWKMGGTFMLNLSQSSFSHWAAGGEDMVSSNALLNFNSRYLSEEISWENNVDVAFGINRQQGLSRKTDDKIDIASKLGKPINEKLYYAGLLNFKTQFRPGYNYPNDSVKISNFFAPAYLIAAIGLDYKPHPSLSFFLAPVSERLSLVFDKALSDSGAFGVDKGKNARFEFGAYFKMLFQKDIMENVNLSTKFEAFSNYLDKPQNIAVNWEVLLSMKINKYLAATVTTQLIYDDAIKYQNEGPKIQFREVLGVGLSYQF